MIKNRPAKRLINAYTPGEGKAKVLDKPGTLSHVLYVASRNPELGNRNVAMILLLFGSALRVTEMAKLKVSDVYQIDGKLKRSFVIPGNYTKTGKPRLVYLIAKQLRLAIEEWKTQRTNEKIMVSSDGTFGGLRGDSPLFLSKKGTWRKYSFNVKKYKTEDGVKETYVSASLENTIRDIFNKAGVQGASSHSGRRSLATWMNRKGCDLELIQRVLGHEDPEMTLTYIDPWIQRIEEAYNKIWRGVELPKQLVGIK